MTLNFHNYNELNLLNLYLNLSLEEKNRFETDFSSLCVTIAEKSPIANVYFFVHQTCVNKNKPILPQLVIYNFVA